MSGLVFERVRIWLGARRLIDLHTTVEPGQILTLMGPSGSGKSTLLSFLCGTLVPAFSAEGRLVLDGEDITTRPPERRHLGILFQDALLFPHLSVAGNLLVALPSSRGGRAWRRAKVAAALAEAGLEGFGERDPATLSGGQQARVALMRTLLTEPRALLLDEPFSKLDATLRQRIRSFVFAEIVRYRLPAILVTHDPEDATAAGGPVHHLGTGLADAAASA
jgi:putative thiamine transport system ATP-binding protein